MIHWGYGMVWGAIYRMLRNPVPRLRFALGLSFDIACSLVGDELMNSVTGLTPPLYPIDAHVRGLAGHVALTAAPDGTYHALQVAIG